MFKIPETRYFFILKTLCDLNTKIDLFWESLPLPPRQAPSCPLAYRAPASPGWRWGTRESKVRDHPTHCPWVVTKGSGNCQNVARSEPVHLYIQRQASKRLLPSSKATTFTCCIWLIRACAERKRSAKRNTLQSDTTNAAPSHCPVLWSHPSTRQPS